MAKIVLKIDEYPRSLMNPKENKQRENHSDACAKREVKRKL